MNVENILKLFKTCPCVDCGGCRFRDDSKGYPIPFKCKTCQGTDNVYYLGTKEYVKFVKILKKEAKKKNGT